MTEKERREAEIRSIMKLIGGTETEEKKPAPKKTAKTTKGAK